MTDRGIEEPQAIFAQPELPLIGVDALDAIRRMEHWIATHPERASDATVSMAHVYLHDSDTRAQRAERWNDVRAIEERCINEWGLLMHGGTETMWLLGEAAHGLINGLWLASLLCSHAACERHLAGVLSLDADTLPTSWELWGLGPLLKAAKERDIVPPDLWEPLTALNETRKVSAHFKPPTHEGSLMQRAFAREPADWLVSAQELAEVDAFAAYETARSLVHRARWA